MKPFLGRDHAGLARQFSTFFVIGLLVAAVHYGILIALVEGAGQGPVLSSLVGYSAGGVVSYALNRRFTYASGRPHREAGWRFALVAGSGFVLTGILMYFMTEVARLPYLLAQLGTTGIVLVWHFAAHKLFTFAD